MTPFERAADCYDANSRARKRARTRRAQQAALRADIACVLGEVEAVLAALPIYIVRTPSGGTTVKDVAGHVQQLLRRLNATPNRQDWNRRNPIPSCAVDDICDAAHNLLAAIDGVTDQFNGEVKAMRRALCRTRAAGTTSLNASRRKETA